MTKVAVLSSHNGSGFDTLYQASKNKILDIDISLIISNNTNAKIIQNAKKLNIENHIINDKLFKNVDEEIVKLLNKHKYQYIFLSGYMKKISPLITSNFKVINSHPSLLPLYGGAGMYGRFVHEAVIKNNETVSGITIHEVNEVYDEGKIILQRELLLNDSETAESLELRIKELEKSAIIDGFRKCLK